MVSPGGSPSSPVLSNSKSLTGNTHQSAMRGVCHGEPTFIMASWLGGFSRQGHEPVPFGYGLGVLMLPCLLKRNAQ